MMLRASPALSGRMMEIMLPTVFALVQNKNISIYE
jgi:hypothetical protein